jgi:hypothetical protein
MASGLSVLYPQGMVQMLLELSMAMRAKRKCKHNDSDIGRDDRDDKSNTGDDGGQCMMRAPPASNSLVRQMVS